MFCNESFLVFKYLKCHIKFKHNDQLNSEVKCNFFNCTNSYSTVYSLFRHMYTVHDTQSNTKKQKKYDNKSVVSNESIDNENNFHNLNLISNVTNSEPTFNNKEKDFFQDISKKMSNVTLRLITSLYCFENLNRKDIHKIINNIFSTYLSENFELLQEKYGNTSNIYNDLNIIKNSFKKFKVNIIL